MDKLDNFRDWLVDYWDLTVKEDIHKAVFSFVNGLHERGRSGTVLDDVDKDELTEDISERLKYGLFNVIDTFLERIYSDVDGSE